MGAPVARRRYWPFRAETGSTATTRSRGDERVGERAYPAVIAAAGVAAIAAVVILWQARFLTFFGDEWNVLLGQPGLLEPHNEHWSTGLYLAYDAILAVAGGRSYLPFMLVLVACHLAAAAGLYALLRRGASPWVAAGAVILLLLLGSADEDLFWAWQIGWIGAVALGLWALVATESDHPRTAALLLTAAVATSGVGLFFLAATVAFTVLSRRTVRWLAIPVLGYLAWFVAFGIAPLSSIGTPTSSTVWTDEPGFVLAGLLYASGAVLGLGFAGVAPLAAALIAAVCWRGRRDPLVVAMLVGLVAEYALIALVRDGVIAQAWTAPRYVYPAAAFLLAALARSIPPRPPFALRAVAAATFGVALLVNVTLLITGPRMTRLRLDTPFGCLPRSIAAGDAGWGADVTVPAGMRCEELPA